MMDCEKIGDVFRDLHDQQIDGDMGDSAREHLRNCPCCREDFKWYGITVHALNRLDRAHPPDDFLDQLHSRIHATSSPSSLFDSFRNFFSSFPQLPLPVGVTALTCVVAVAWAVYSYTPAGVLPPVPSKETPRIAAGTLAGRSPVAERRGLVPGDARGEAGQMLAKASQIPPATTQGFPSHPGIAIPKSLNSSGTILPAGSVIIGSDNLTVESPSMNLAVESLKRALPQIQGRLVEEKTRDGLGETTLAVMIPPQAWPNLTTELINHGAVAVGAKADQETPVSMEKDGRNVLIRIRIVNTP
jgi:hypothetical protein